MDESALDTGDFPTTPAAPFGRATNDNIIEIEGQRLAEFVTLPFEVDPELVANANPTVIKHAGQLSMSLSQPMVEAVDQTGILYGYATAADTTTLDATDVPNDLVHLVLRAANPEDAQTIARDLQEATLTSADEYDVAYDAWIPLDSRLNDALTSQRTDDLNPAGDRAVRQSIVAHDDYVIYDWAAAPIDNAKWAERALGKALELQKPLIDRFPATPTDSQNDGVPVDLPMMDQNDLLIYTVPGVPGDADGRDMAVYGPRGMAHGALNPTSSYQVLEEVGSAHNAVGRTVVYRADKDAGATTIVEKFSRDLTNHGFSSAESPAGLAGATCLTRMTEFGEQNACYITNGRYVGEATSDSLTEAHQLISAQHLILGHADQDA
ncbi:hypothetical protein G6016_01370 [Dietzia aerolata]|uniref:Uncharacterized protein n=1 Tax=Dietzia aerolata TaxID=595984 RepID=A0ABV5JMF6_9ACTN|nr:hypothetical protein [Dietzia aerolata]MBB0967631.1 hypothetical protein [Dietzia aerolata]